MIPKVSVDVTITLTMSQMQARDVMDDLIRIDPRATDEVHFSSDGSRDVYNALSAAIGARVL